MQIGAGFGPAAPFGVDRAQQPGGAASACVLEQAGLRPPAQDRRSGGQQLGHASFDFEQDGFDLSACAGFDAQPLEQAGVDAHRLRQAGPGARQLNQDGPDARERADRRRIHLRPRGV